MDRFDYNEWKVTLVNRDANFLGGGWDKDNYVSKRHCVSVVFVFSLYKPNIVIDISIIPQAIVSTFVKRPEYGSIKYNGSTLLEHCFWQASRNSRHKHRL